jgi:hypothetical protein
MLASQKLGSSGCIFKNRCVRKLVMAKPKNPPQNAVGTTHGVLRNTEGTLKGRYGTVGGPPSQTPKNAKK